MRKLEKVKSNLRNKYQCIPHKKNEETLSNLDKLKIIGVTGSKGKSSVVYMISKYLKQLGFKVVAYSSIEIDSPLSYAIKNESVENPLYDEVMLLSIIEEALDYDADYLVMEVNERAIKKGLTKDIPFDIRVITNIDEKHNIHFYPDYVNIKKNFFKEANEDTTLISVLKNKQTIELKKEFKRIITFSSNYIKNLYNIDDVNYVLTYNDKKHLDTINGLSMKIVSNESEEVIETNLIMPYNALNITCCVAVLKQLGVFDYLKFSSFIKNLIIPGRDEVIRYKERTIIISLSLAPQLENLKIYQQRNEINKIRVVAGTSGLNFISWKKEFIDSVYYKEKEEAMNFAYKYISENSDYLYITTSDSGTASKQDLVEYQYQLVKDKIIAHKIIDRKEAIRKAIEDSFENDVIFISGRGNRRLICDGFEHVKELLDKDAVLEVIKGGSDDV